MIHEAKIKPPVKFVLLVVTMVYFKLIIYLAAKIIIIFEMIRILTSTDRMIIEKKLYLCTSK